MLQAAELRQCPLFVYSLRVMVQALNSFIERAMRSETPKTIQTLLFELAWVFDTRMDSLHSWGANWYNVRTYIGNHWNSFGQSAKQLQA